MSEVKRDENGMIMPIKTTYPALASEKSKLSNVYGKGDKTTDEEPKSAEQAEKENESSGNPIGLDEKYTRPCRPSANIRTAKSSMMKGLSRLSKNIICSIQRLLHRRLKLTITAGLERCLYRTAKAHRHLMS